MGTPVEKTVDVAAEGGPRGKKKSYWKDSKLWTQVDRRKIFQVWLGEQVTRAKEQWMEEDLEYNAKEIHCVWHVNDEMAGRHTRKFSSFTFHWPWESYYKAAWQIS